MDDPSRRVPRESWRRAVPLRAPYPPANPPHSAEGRSDPTRMARCSADDAPHGARFWTKEPCRAPRAAGSLVGSVKEDRHPQRPAVPAVGVAGVAVASPVPRVREEGEADAEVRLPVPVEAAPGDPADVQRVARLGVRRNREGLDPDQRPGRSRAAADDHLNEEGGRPVGLPPSIGVRWSAFARPVRPVPVEALRALPAPSAPVVAPRGPRTRPWPAGSERPTRNSTGTRDPTLYN